MCLRPFAPKLRKKITASTRRRLRKNKAKYEMCKVSFSKSGKKRVCLTQEREFAVYLHMRHVMQLGR